MDAGGGRNVWQWRDRGAKYSQKQGSHGGTRAAVGGTPMTQQHLAVVVVDRYRRLVAVAVQAVVADGQN